MIGNILEDDLGEMYRQRGRWFLLLGALLGSIFAIAAALGFWLEQWGNHIGGGRGENVHDIAVGLAIALLIAVIVIALMVWRATTYLAKANDFVPTLRKPSVHASDTVSSAVAVWTSSALGSRSEVEVSPATGVTPASTPLGRSSVSAISRTSEQPLQAVAATEITVGSNVSDVSLADIIQSIQNSGIQIEGLWSATGPQGYRAHLVLQRSADTDARLAEAGLYIGTSQDVVLVEFEDRPGAAADIIRRLTDAGVRVSSAQLATGTRMVVVSDDPDGAAKALR
jgi:hypothetical protein